MTAPVVPYFKVPPLPLALKDLKEVQKWSESLVRELNDLFGYFRNFGGSIDLRGSTTTQLVAAGFTIEPVATVLVLIAAGPVTSDVNVAIKLGIPGQLLILRQSTANNITLKTAAATRLAGAVDYIFTNRDTLLLYYDHEIANWVELARSVN